MLGGGGFGLSEAHCEVTWSNLRVHKIKNFLLKQKQRERLLTPLPLKKIVLISTSKKENT
jgi:hypothetical protein